MIARWITDAAALTALAPDWAALCDRSSACSPFERPEWLLPWVAVFGGAARLRVLTIERGGELAGVVPLMETSAGGAVRLEFLGAGVSDYHDAVLADVRPDSGPELGPSLRAVMWRALAESEWTTCALDRLRSGSPLLGALPELDPAAGIAGEATGQESCPALLSAPGARSVGDLIPAGYARRLARGRRHLERNHRVTVRVPTSAAQAEELFAGLSALHAARWQLRGEPGVLAHGSVQRFHRLVIRAMWPRGLLRIFGLDLGGSLAAVVYGFAVHGRMAFYLSAFDPERANLSPSAQLIALVIERLLAEGVVLFDFLRGRESYKYRFGAVDRPCFGLTLQRTGTSSTTTVPPRTTTPSS